MGRAGCRVGAARTSSIAVRASSAPIRSSRASGWSPCGSPGRTGAVAGSVPVSGCHSARWAGAGGGPHRRGRPGRTGPPTGCRAPSPGGRPRCRPPGPPRRARPGPRARRRRARTAPRRPAGRPARRPGVPVAPPRARAHHHRARGERGGHRGEPFGGPAPGRRLGPGVDDDGAGRGARGGRGGDGDVRRVGVHAVSAQQPAPAFAFVLGGPPFGPCRAGVADEAARAECGQGPQALRSAAVQVHGEGGGRAAPGDRRRDLAAGGPGGDEPVHGAGGRDGAGQGGGAASSSRAAGYVRRSARSAGTAVSRSPRPRARRTTIRSGGRLTSGSRPPGGPGPWWSGSPGRAGRGSGRSTPAAARPPAGPARCSRRP